MPYAYTKALPRQGQQVGRKTHHEYDAAPLGAVYRWRTHFPGVAATNISALTGRNPYALCLHKGIAPPGATGW